MLKLQRLFTSMFPGFCSRLVRSAALALAVLILAIPGYAVLNTTTTSMTSGPAGNTPYGSQTPYVATVSVNGGGTATGTVTFCDTTGGTCSAGTGPNIIGTVTLTNASNNVASLIPTTPLSIGSHTIIANYAGDTSNAPSTTTNSIVTNIQAVNTTTSYTLTPGGGSASAPPVTIVFSQAISGTATASAQSGGGTPTGTVQFAVDGTNVGSAVLLTAGSAATALGSSLAVGNHTVSAAFTPAGGTGWNASTGNNGGATAIVVNQAGTTVATSLAGGAGTGTPTLRVTMTGTAPATTNPTSGTVILYDGTPGNVGASTVLGTGTLTGTNSVLITSTVTLTSAGNPHNIWAAFAGNANFTAGISTGESYNVTPPTATTVQQPTGPTSFAYGQSVSYTGTVTAASGTTNPGGAANSGNTLTFCFALSATPGTPVLCSTGIQVTNSVAGPTVGQASYTVPANTQALTPGSYVLTTTYHNQDGLFTNSGPSTALNVTVTKAAAPFTISSTVAPGQNLTVTQPVTVTATYTGSLSPNPTGSLTLINTANLGATICAATLTNGVASCTATAGPGGAAGLQPGPVTISISYAGDTNYSLGTVTPESFAVAKDQVNMTVTATSTDSPNPTQMGRTVTLTATVTAKTINVSPAGTTPTQANISITPPATNVASSTCGTPTAGATTTNSATVSCTFVLTGTLPSPPTLNFSASYSGDNYTTSSGASNSIAVSAGAATHFTVSAPATATAGTAFNITLTALDQFGNTATGYTGTVHFTSSDTSATLPANTALTNGTGTFSATLKTSSSQTITATDTVTASITGTSNAITVSGGAATHFTVSAPASATSGSAISFTVAALDASNNTATGYGGTVHFTSSDTSATLPANATLTNGTGTFSATLRTAGSQTITAADTVTSSITGTSGAIAVGAGSTSTSVSPSAGTVTYGTSQTFSATVTSGGAAVTAGTVTFADTTTSTTLASNVALNSSGQAATTATLAAGSHTIQATYNPDANHTGSSGSSSVTVNKATLTVTANNATKAVGAALPTFSATFTGFVNGDTAAVSGTPSLTTTATVASPAGNYPITVSAGTLSAANYTFAFVNGTLVVTTNPSIVINTAGTTPAVGPFFGQSFTTPSGGPWYNITFNFFSDQGVTPVAAGTAYLFTVPYAGTPAGLSANLSGASSAITAAADTVRAAVASPQPFASAPGFVGASIATSGGTYIFSPSLQLQPNTQYFVYEDAPLSGVLNGSGMAGGAEYAASSSTTPFAAAGSSTNFGVTGAVVPPPPLTSSIDLTSTTFQSTFGQTVTFTAAVSGSGGVGVATPTGTVQFLDGATLLATVALNNGRATFSTAALTAGSHVIVASYSGGNGYPATQASIGLNVFALASTLTVSATPANPIYGQSVTLTANVTGAATPPAGFGPPTGQVTFALPGASLYQPTSLGTVNLVSGVASLTLSTLPVGMQTIVAQYSGDSVWGASTHQVAVTVSIASSSASVSLSVSGGNQLVLTSSVAPIAPGAGTPTGSVQFVDVSTKAIVASANLSGGKASATASAAATVLARPIAAQYSGDANFSASMSAPLPALVNAAGNLSTSFAADEIASIFGVTGMNGDTPASLPLTTSLAGAAVSVTDSAGAARPALLYGVFASAGQINFLIPSGTATGWAEVTITLPGGTLTTAINIANTAPGVFTANMNGQGPYAGQVVYGHSDGTQTVVSSVVPGSGNTFAPNPISLSGRGDQVYLVLYGTGIRHAASLTATINGVSVPVAYFGAQGSYPGLDQINLGPLPVSLAGAGTVNLIVTADGQAANPVAVTIE